MLCPAARHVVRHASMPWTAERLKKILERMARAVRTADDFFERIPQAVQEADEFFRTNVSSCSNGCRCEGLARFLLIWP